MNNKLENDKKRFNTESSEKQIFEKIKEDLSPIQENLSEKKITVDEARSELKKINEWLQWTNLKTQEKKEIWKAFEKLTKLEKNVDEITLKNEVSEIMKLLEKLTQKDLEKLKQDIKWEKHQETIKRPTEVQAWIQKSSKNLDSTINNAAEDKNPVAKRIWKAMKRLNS